MSIYWAWYTLMLVTLDWVVVAVGIVGNALILVCLVKYKTLRNPVTKILFINLAISDLGVLLVRHSFDSIQLYKEGRWIFGELGCKLIPPALRTFLTVSIVTLVLISYYRYKSIVRVLKSQPSVTKTTYLIILLWVIVLTVYACLDIPFRNWNTTNKRCSNDILSHGKYIAFVIAEKTFYTLCFISIFYMFSRTKKAIKGNLKDHGYCNLKKSPCLQILKILRPTVFVLLITLIPAWIIHTTAAISRKVFPETQVERYLMYHVVGILMVFNSAANPFIYIIMSRSFRSSIKQLWRFSCHEF